MDFRVLGPLEVVDGNGPLALGGPKQRAALVLLLLRANRIVPAERLIDELWPDEPPAAARNVLQSYVSRLRRLLGADRLEHRPGGYVLNADASEIDVHRFETLVADARRQAAIDPASAVRLYQEADGLWRGPALDDLADQPSLRGEIAHLEELRAAEREDRIALELALGRDAELVAELETLVDLHPLREALWARLMTALYRAGRQADALAAYRRARQALAELGLEPSTELRHIERQVLRHDPALDLPGVPVRGFRLLERVGEGSFGVVHRALQPQVEREVAVKVVRPELADDPEFIRRFDAEAQLVARLEHPHIVPLYDYWREPGGAYLVMRYLRGGSLRDALARGPLELHEALRVMEQVGAALASAHRQGVVHRDVKPANILFDEDRNAYLSDFGIARAVTSSHAAEARIGLGSSAYYLSPEERRGEPPSERADVYSLGLVLFEMLAGRHPYSDVRPEELVRDGLGPVPSLRSVLPDSSPIVDEVVRTATYEDPAGRYGDAAAFVSALVTAAEAPAAVPVAPLRNPYKGLRPFLEPDAPDFAGRETLVRRLVDRLADSRFLALVGPSGSGKSSAVRAGLVPALRAGGLPGSDRWLTAELVPGADPFAELVAALQRLAPAPPPRGLLRGLAREPAALVEAAEWLLPDEATELLLVVDQLEELFTLAAGEEVRARFLATLRAAATEPGSRVRIVTTLRADFFDRPLAYGDVAELVRTRTELVVPLTAEELERAISHPARRAGVTVEPALVAQLVADVAGRPGALPLLQFSLAELFDRRRGSTLTLAAYDGLGRVAGAVAHGAEEIYGALPPGRQAAARELFLRLVDAGEADRTRRRVLYGELVSLTQEPAEMQAVIEAFAARRLLSLDHDEETRAPTVEVAHEALLEAWDRLRGWIDEAQDDLRTQRRVAAAAREWLDAGRETSFLIGGSRLEQLESWRARAGLALTPAEREFLDASVAERDRLGDEDAARRVRERELERRSVRRLRGVVAVLTAAAVVAAGLTVFAFAQRDDAQRERRVAVGRELAAAAVANLDVDAERSVLLALDAVERTRSPGGAVLPEIEEALHRAVVASRIVLRVPGLGGALDWSPDGSVFVTEGPEQSGVIDVRDARTGRSVRSFHGHDADVNLVAFSADGSRLATSGDDGAVNVWDPETGERVRSFPGSGPAWGVSFSPDGSLLAASSWAAGSVSVWDLRTGRLVRRIRSLDPSLATSFSPDGRRLAIATWDPGAVVVDVRSGRIVFTLQGQRFGVSDVDWSPDGRWLATSSLDSTVRIWDAQTGRWRFTLFGHRGEVVAADWSADSRRLATGSNDGSAKVWAVDEMGPRELLSISAQERGGGLWVAFSPDGDRLMTGDQEITAVKVWDVSTGGDAEWANAPAVAGEPGGVTFTADGRRIVAGGADGTVTVWDAETGRHSLLLRHAGAVPAARAVSTTAGGLVAAARGEGASVWSLATREPLFDVPGAGAEDVAWSPDGSLLAVAGLHGLVRIVDRTGKFVASLRGGRAGFRTTAVAFSPDGRLVASAHVPMGGADAGEPQVTLWNLGRRTALRHLPVVAEAVAFSPDGARVATAPLFGPVRLWDVGSGREAGRLAGHTGAVNDVAFSPDGSLLATASADGTVRLWDARRYAQRLVLRGHVGVVWNVAFSPDGSKLASAGPEGIVRVWALDLDDLVAIARRKVTRELTADECRQYLHAAECA